MAIPGGKVEQVASLKALRLTGVYSFGSTIYFFDPYLAATICPGGNPKLTYRLANDTPKARSTSVSVVFEGLRFIAKFFA